MEGRTGTTLRHRIYVAGPYSAPTLDGRVANVNAAVRASIALADKGHLVHCPHAATHQMDVESNGRMGYEYWMSLDMSIISQWATALFVVGESPGTLREIKHAERLFLSVYRNIEEVPDVAR